MTLENLWQIVWAVASAALYSDAVQDKAQAFWGRKLRAYVGGVDTFNADAPEERFPYLAVYPVSTDSTNGNRVSTIRAELCIRADTWGDSTKPPLREAENMPLQFGMGINLSELADAVEASIRAADLGAVLEGVRVEMDLQNQYLVQTASFDLEFSDTQTF